MVEHPPPASLQTEDAMTAGWEAAKWGEVPPATVWGQSSELHITIV